MVFQPAISFSFIFLNEKRQTAVTAYYSSYQLLLFAVTHQYSMTYTTVAHKASYL